MNEVTREEYNVGQGRLHERINAIKESSIRIEESTKRSEDMVNKMFNVMYGNGKEGLITKVSNILGILKTHKFIMGTILSGLLGLAIFIIRNRLIE